MVESLEGRQLLTTLSVDIADSGCAMLGDHNYCQIQDAIDAAAEGDVIEVASGTYDRIRIRTDNLTLRAVEGATPTIDAGGESNAVLLRADGVTVQGLTVENAVLGFDVRGNSNILTENHANRIGPAGQSAAFKLSGGERNTFSENTAHDASNGFWLLNSDSNTLENNHVDTASLHGFLINQSDFNTLHQNTALNSQGNGFVLWSDSDSNVLTENTAQGSGASGITVLSSSNNTIENNLARGNRWGITVGRNYWASENPPPAESNIFINNTAESNEETGFGLAEAYSNTFRGNLAKDNGGSGFRITHTALDKQFGDSEANTFQDNVAVGNAGYAFSIPSVDEALANMFENNRCVENASGPANQDVIDCSLPPADDANLDGRFNQLDIVQVLQANKYLSDEPAVWREGDWNNDGRFDQADVVAALQTGSYLA